MANLPCIKGIFVNSHIKALRAKAGAEAVQELRRRFGRPLKFGSLEDVPVRDEVEILEHILDILHGGSYTKSDRDEAAGRLHFLNFLETSLGSTLMSALPRTPGSFETLLKNAHSISRSIFSNMEIRCEVRSKGLRITITNCDYPSEHFKGFFEAWMEQWNLQGASVEVGFGGEGTYRYDLTYAR